ncbi:MAG TPA: glycoside hydrolase family 16 protein [Jiangellales bacterium]|nr:glycoside hydrolase family 16 protein [Jiangellales bacterium]
MDLTATEYELVFEDRFRGADLDRERWLPYHLPHWSSRRQSAARYSTGEDGLRLRIDAGQPPWCPELDGDTRVSNLQTAVVAGPVGSPIGQHRFHPDAVVREAQEDRRLLTVGYGVVELVARMPIDPRTMAALWMIGLEDRPERSGEICVCEVFGREAGPDRALVGMGVHPFGDPDLVDDFDKVEVGIDVTRPHAYAIEWTSDRIGFHVDGRLFKTVRQSPSYPMQLMLGVYEFGGQRPHDRYPKEFRVDRVRVYRAAGA